MLVPLEQAVGTGYNAGLTATAFAFQPDGSAGGGYTSPSGLPIGGLRVGYDVDYHKTAVDAQSRYVAGPPALLAGSESGYLPKDRSVPYLTEEELAARHFVSGVGTICDPSYPPCGDPRLAGVGDLSLFQVPVSGIPLWVWVVAAWKFLL